MHNFINKLEDSLINYSLVKVTLSKPVANKSNLKNVIVRPVMLKNKKIFQLVYRYEKRDETKNYNASQTLFILKDLIHDLFLKASLFTITEDVTFSIGNKGKNNMTCKRLKEPRVQDFNHDHEKHRLIDPQKPWWHLLGLTTNDGRIVADMQHKYKQICKYVEIVDGVMRQVKFENDIYIADMGAGKGYLTFALYEYLTTHYDKKIIMEGVEIRKDLVLEINNIINQCGLNNFIFTENSIENYKPSKLDILIALHACDTATDDAILKGIRNKAKLIICAPCCHKQIRREMEKSGKTNSITRFGIFLERQAVMITDAIRALVLEYCDYKTQVMEFIDIDNTPKNVLLVGKKTDKQADKDTIAKNIRDLLEQYDIEEHYLWRNLWRKL